MKLLLIGAGFNPIPTGMMCLYVEERIASGAALPRHNKPPPLPAWGDGPPQWVHGWRVALLCVPTWASDRILHTAAAG